MGREDNYNSGRESDATIKLRARAERERQRKQRQADATAAAAAAAERKSADKNASTEKTSTAGASSSSKSMDEKEKDAMLPPPPPPRIDSRFGSPGIPQPKRSMTPTYNSSSAPPGHGTTTTTTTTTTAIASHGMVTAPPAQYGQVTVPQVPDNELVEAMPIDPSDEFGDGEYYKEDGFNGPIVVAKEYDPNAKPPFYQNRRFRLYAIVGVLAFVFFAIVLIIVVVAVGGSDDNGPDDGDDNDNGRIIVTRSPTVSPSQSPSTTEAGDFRRFFESHVGTDVYQPGTPHYSATNWMINEDPLTGGRLDLTSPRLLQRFILVLLYFTSTRNGNTVWTSCNPPSSSSSSETNGEEAVEDDSLSTFCRYETPTRDSEDEVAGSGIFIDSIRWLSSANECEWLGVHCVSGDQVVGISITFNNLQGPIPSELALLPLQVIEFEVNVLTGTIPSELADITNLVVLSLHTNMLTGTIPEEFFSLTDQSENTDNDGINDVRPGASTSTLQEFNVGRNFLTGTAIDTRMGHFTSLRGLHLFGNTFSASTIPTEFASLTDLRFVRLSETDFSVATIPTELVAMTRLNELWLDQCQLSGTLPIEVASLTSLESLFLHTNANLGGTIPEEWYTNLTRLRRIRLEGMAITGTISPSIGRWSNIRQDLILSNNTLTGTIPTEIGLINRAEFIGLQFNMLSGTMPTEICGTNRPSIGIQADCFPQDPITGMSYDGVALVSCPSTCCTSCCNQVLEPPCCDFVNTDNECKVAGSPTS